MDWRGLLVYAIENVVVPVVLSLLGVRAWRGPITNRKGLPPKAPTGKAW